ncbi:MAG: hypothetical protein AAFU85_27065 [Planctomycetota bacterium]
MITNVFSRHAESIDREFGDETFLVSRLKRLSAINLSVEDSLSETMARTSQPDHTSKTATVAAAISEAVAKWKVSTKTSRLFAEIDSAARKSEQFSGGNSELNTHLQEFGSAYERYIDSQNAKNACQLIIEAHRSYAGVSMFRDTVVLIAEVLSESQPEPREDEGTLTLYFPQVVRLDALLEKLIAIEEIYRELLDLMGLSIVDHPLRIAKVESGSLFVRIIGAIFPTELLGDFTRKAAEVLFRRYLTEGKIEAEGEYRKEIAETIQLRNSLNEIGIDTSGLDDRLERAANQHAERLCKLMYGESDVEVNGVSVSIAGIQEAETIESRAPRLIEYELLKTRLADPHLLTGNSAPPLIEGPDEPGDDDS